MTKKELTQKEMSRRGGKARAESLSDKQRKEIAKKAATVRWSKKGKADE
jgi:hypothetical protein